MTLDEFRELTKDCTVDFKLYGGSLVQLCVNDLDCSVSTKQYFVSRTGIKIPYEKIDTVELRSILK